jgi:hypothetical protein
VLKKLIVKEPRGHPIPELLGMAKESHIEGTTGSYIGALLVLQKGLDLLFGQMH